MRNNKTLALVPVIFALLYISGCAAEEMMPLHTVESGTSTVEILTPGGKLKSGYNPIIVRVTTGGDATELDDAELMFSMPAMGSMPYMEMQTVFAEGSEGGEISGNLTFNMGGSWTGHLNVVIADAPITATFPMRVDE